MRALLGEDLNRDLVSALKYVSEIDPVLGQSLTYLYQHKTNAAVIDSLGLFFNFIGHASIPLCDNGLERPVSSENVVEYLRLTVEWFFDISAHITAFHRGFRAIMPLSVLQLLLPTDWARLWADPNIQLWPGGADEIKANLICDHGYTSESQAIQWLVQILEDLRPAQQRLFVRFVTGAHRLPIGGLAKLDPTLTVVRKFNTVNPEEAIDPHQRRTIDDMLPSASTCTNYLKLPDYSSMEIMRSKLLYCIEEGQLSFHLS